MDSHGAMGGLQIVKIEMTLDSHIAKKGYDFSQNNKVSYGYSRNKSGRVIASYITIKVGSESLTYWGNMLQVLP